MSKYKIFTCPFCQETDFDAIGLKMHFLRGWCDTFNLDDEQLAAEFAIEDSCES